MSVQHAGSGRGRWKTVICAGLWLATMAAGPALAAHYLETDSHCVNDAVRSDPPGKLNAVAVSGYDLDLRHDSGVLTGHQSDKSEPVTYVPDDAAKPPLVRLEQTRSALAESSIDSGNEFAPGLRTEQQDTGALDARIPGITDDELQRFKRQMYRKDI